MVVKMVASPISSNRAKPYTNVRKTLSDEELNWKIRIRIMTIFKKSVARVLLALGLATIILVIVPNPLAYADPPISSIEKLPDGGTKTESSDGQGGRTTTYKDKDGTVTSTNIQQPDGKGGYSSKETHKDGSTVTGTSDSNGYASTSRDKDGNVTATNTTTYDGKGGRTSVSTDVKAGTFDTFTTDGKGNHTDTKTDLKTGNVTIETKDASGNYNTTVKDKKRNSRKYSD